MSSELSILELFVLSLIDRGLKTKYDLQTRGGISLGSSSPALKRMQVAKLVTQDVSTKPGARPRHELKLTAAGKKLVGTGWKDRLREAKPTDIESVLRLVDMAAHTGTKPSELSAFLREVSSTRLSKVTSAAESKNVTASDFSFINTQVLWENLRSQAESKFLLRLADSGPSRKSAQRTKAGTTKHTRR